MTIIPSILLAILFITAIGIVLLVLFQNKGGTVGSAFGGGSNTVFGARGAGDFLSRTTAIFATVFFASALALAAYYNTNNPQTNNSVIQSSSVTSQNATDSDLPAVDSDVQDESAPAIPE